MNLALVVLVGFGAITANARITEPFQIYADAKAAMEWQSFDRLPLPAAGTIALAAVGSPGVGRMDILSRRGQDWVLEASARYVNGTKVPPSDHSRGVLLRFANTAEYWFGIARPGELDSIILRPFRTVAVHGVPQRAAIALFMASAASPRVVGAERILRMVPVEPGVLCVFESESSACAILPRDVSAPEPPTLHLGRTTRLFRAPEQLHGRLEVRRRREGSARATDCGKVMARAGPWSAIEITEDSNWDDVIVDWSGDQYATERIAGGSAMQLPMFGEFSAQTDRGFAVRPFVGGGASPA
jgi:hypothetical protein